MCFLNNCVYLHSLQTCCITLQDRPGWEVYLICAILPVLLVKDFQCNLVYLNIFRREAIIHEAILQRKCQIFFTQHESSKGAYTLVGMLNFFFLQRKLSFDLIAINLVLFIYFLWQGLPVKLDPADIEKQFCFSKHIMQGDTGLQHSLKSEKETTHIRNQNLHELAEEYDWIRPYQPSSFQKHLMTALDLILGQIYDIEENVYCGLSTCF